MKEGCNQDEMDERYFVRGRKEILNVLNDLIQRCEPITVSFNNGTDRFVTRLLEAREQVAIFDLAGDGATHLRLLASRDCFFVARPDGILVQFWGNKASRISWGGSEALSVPLPQCVATLQDQESFRILMPAASALTVHLFGGDGAPLGAWPLHDLSVGGLGVTVGDQARLQRGQSIARVSLLLPDHGVIDCAVRFGHSSGFPKNESNSSYRIGVGFCALPAEMRAAIQRFILNMAHEQRGLIA